MSFYPSCVVVATVGFEQAESLPQVGFYPTLRAYAAGQLLRRYCEDVPRLVVGEICFGEICVGERLGLVQRRDPSQNRMGHVAESQEPPKAGRPRPIQNGPPVEA